MRIRPFSFSFSVLLATLLYGLLLTLAPRILLFEFRQNPQDLETRYQVSLRDIISEPLPREEDPDPGTPANGFASRPGSVRDLLEREHELLSTEDARNASFADVQDVPTRIASDADRERYELDPAPDVLNRVDTRILEINESDARRSLDIARRVVRPSPSTLVPEGVTPSLRSLLDSGERSALRFDEARGESRLFANAPVNPAVEGVPGSPRYEGPEPGPSDPFDVPGVGMAEQSIPGAPGGKTAGALKAASGYEFLDDMLDIRVDTYIPDPNRTGYFRLRFLPKADGKFEILAKDITFVIDASSSIPQRKLDLSVRGLQNAIDTLRDIDRFNVVIFRDAPHLFRPEWVTGTADNRSAAKAFLNGLESRGETDVYKALLPVVQQMPRRGVPGIVYVISDGRPTAGVMDGRTIINGLTADNRTQQSIFGFGGGKTVNEQMIDLLTYRNKGDAVIETNIEVIDKALVHAISRLKDPLLVEIRANYGNVDATQVYPKVLPDLYRDKPVVVYGTFNPKEASDFVLRLTGLTGEKSKEVIFHADLKKADAGDESIARKWAFEKAYDVIGEMTRKGDLPELRAQLQDLRDRFGIRTSYDQ
ncbi:MAG: VWA domain-containing protein [Candidatus Hydrogenedentes bacterium]|nr:VWA domain-containing protein [Candidatus Hydrogenedentota bacterium]